MRMLILSSVVQPHSVTSRGGHVVGMTSPPAMASTGSEALLLTFPRASMFTHHLWITQPTAAKVNLHTLDVREQYDCQQYAVSNIT